MYERFYTKPLPPTGFQLVAVGEGWKIGWTTSRTQYVTQYKIRLVFAIRCWACNVEIKKLQSIFCTKMFSGGNRLAMSTRRLPPAVRKPPARTSSPLVVMHQGRRMSLSPPALKLLSLPKIMTLHYRVTFWGLFWILLKKQLVRVGSLAKIDSSPISIQDVLLS